MTRTDSENRLADGLTRLAEYAATEPTTQPGLTEVTPVDDLHRSGPPIWAAVPAAAVVLVAIALVLSGVLGGSDNTVHTRSGSPSDTPVAGEPTGPALHALEINATNFRFDSQHYDVPAGITEITFVATEGSHTLAFAEPRFAYVELASPGGRSTAKVDFVEGQTYTIFCTIAGHRAAGMEATITVGPPEAASMTDATTTTTIPVP
jgi:Copper binding proteins, plastocyanin/azurin family.